jgi:peptidyl-prolyl cis-trans isomerase D
MLQQMRTGAKSGIIKFILFGMLIMATLGLVLMDVQGMFRGSTGSKTIVATVAGEKITIMEFDRLYQNQLRRDGVSPVDAWRQGLPQASLQQEVNSRLMARATRDMGLLVDDATAAREIKKILQPMTKGGLSEEQALQRVLGNVGISEGMLVRTVKDQIARESLLSAIAGGVAVPEQMVNDAMRYRHEERRGEYFTLTAADAGDIPAPSDDELKKFYDQSAVMYMQPETRSFAVLVLNRKSLGLPDAPKAPTDAEIKAYYDANADEFKASAGREITQVIVKDEDIANDIFDAAKTGGDLKKAAAEAKQKTSGGTFTDTGLPEELAGVFKAKDGDILAPVQSALGWHVVKVEKTVEAKQKPLDAVRKQIAAKLAAANSADALYDRANEIDDMIAGGKSLSDIAEQFNVRETVFDSLTATAKPQSNSIPAFDKVLQAAFALDEGEASSLIETPDGFVVAEVRKVTKAAPKPFDAVRADVLKNLRALKVSQALEKKTSEIIQRVNLGESFDRVAKDFGGTVERTAVIQRGAENAKAGITPEMTQALFSIGKIGQILPIRAADSVQIVRLSERRVGAPVKAEEKDMNTLRYILSQALQNDILEQFRRDLEDKYDVTLNLALLERTYAPKSSMDGDIE